MGANRTTWLLALALAWTIGCSGTGRKPVGDVTEQDQPSTADMISPDVKGEDGPAQELLTDVGSGDVAPADVSPDQGDSSDASTPPCKSDGDCGFCETCDLSTGQCMPIPCPVECVVDGDCDPGEHCETLENGCCGHCVVDDPCADIDCIHECDKDSDCDAGCICTASGQCAGCGQEVVEVDPICAHAPSVVQAGGPFGVAVYGLPGCSSFDHYELESVGTSHHIRVFAKVSSDPDCPPLATCNELDWSYLGLVWIDAPNPGSYKVQVGSEFQFSVGASGGLIEEPACQDDCGTPLLEDYDWTLIALADTDVLSQCLDAENELYIGEPITMTGTCQNYVLQPIQALDSQVPVKHCTDGSLLFGSKAPYWMEASICGTDPMIDGHLPVILGTIQDAFGSPLPSQLFLVEGIPLWN